MKAVVLCGGLGTRLREETEFRPKPMVEIGGRPILWHIMKMYAKYGIDEFILCLGYKGDMIKDALNGVSVVESVPSLTPSISRISSVVWATIAAIFLSASATTAARVTPHLLTIDSSIHVMFEPAGSV